VLRAVRETARPVFRLYALWGLVDDVEAGLAEFVERLTRSETFWRLAQEPWMQTRMLSLVIQAIGEGYEEHLRQARKPRLTPDAILPFPVEEAEKAIGELRAAERRLREPGHSDLHDLVYPDLAREVGEVRSLWELLLASMKAWAPAGREGRGRPMTPASIVEAGVQIILGERPQAEQNRWAAGIVSDFFGGATKAEDVRRRAASRRRASARRT
jgi:hypothetical protein